MNKMKMMIAASLFVTACGTVQSVDSDENIDSDEMSEMGSDSEDGSETGSGSDTGSGSGSGTASTVDGTITLDPAGFVELASRWWTPTSSPLIRGTYVGKPGATIAVKFGGSPYSVATLFGSQWSLQLPTGAVTSGGTKVTVMLTDAAGNSSTLEQELILDSDAPVVTAMPSTIRDERGDTITFAGEGPHHVHDGVEIDLGSGNCATVYKYAYLMSSSSPTYGDEEAANPLRWNFSATDTQIESASFRVRGANGTVLRDWAPATMIGSLVSVTLHRDGAHGVAELGTQAGQYTLDLRVRDWAGAETLASACWDHQPLAAPIEFGQLGPAAGTVSSWSLVLASPVSRLLNDGVGGSVVEQTLTQYTAEPVLVRPALRPITGSFTRSVLNGRVVFEHADVSPFPCPSIGNCARSTTAATPIAAAGPLTSFSSAVTVVDAATGQPLMTTSNGTTIPARAAGAPPKQYIVRVSLSRMVDLQPTVAASFMEFSFLGFTYTGTPAQDEGPQCIATVPDCEEGYRCSYLCTRTARMTNIAALDAATLNLDPITIDYSGARTFTSPRITWDAGNDDLPGSY